MAVRMNSSPREVWMQKGHVLGVVGGRALGIGWWWSLQGQAELGSRAGLETVTSPGTGLWCTPFPLKKKEAKQVALSTA